MSMSVRIKRVLDGRFGIFQHCELIRSIFSLEFDCYPLCGKSGQFSVFDSSRTYEAAENSEFEFLGWQRKNVFIFGGVHFSLQENCIKLQINNLHDLTCDG